MVPASAISIEDREGLFARLPVRVPMGATSIPHGLEFGPGGREMCAEVCLVAARLS